MRSSLHKRDIVQLTSTPHGLAARVNDGGSGRVILFIGPRKDQWVDITPKWGDDGELEKPPI